MNDERKRQEYLLTEEQHKNLLDACRSMPVMYLPGGQPMFPTPQANANAAWQALGDELGFEWDIVRQVFGKNSRYFSAIRKEYK